jgi:hypothetical protein
MGGDIRNWFSPITMECRQVQRWKYLVPILDLLFGCDKDVLNPVPEADHTFSGTVVSRACQIVSGAVVRVNASADTTDNLGAFEISSIPDGPSRITVSHPDYTVLDSSITVDGDTVLNLVLDPLLHITGTVSSNMGYMIPNTAVQFGTDIYRTDAVGRFSIDRVSPGPHRITFSHPEHVSLDSILVVTGNIDLPVTLTYRTGPTVTVSGTVNMRWYDTMIPVPDVKIFIGNKQGAAKDGTFILHDIPVGRPLTIDAIHVSGNFYNSTGLFI